MKRAVKISIAKPCAENWEQMLPAERGRHCAACDRLITDFSTKSDQEILDYLKHANGKLCGRFNNEQLERNLIQETKLRSISNWEKVAASLLFFIGVEKANASDFSVSSNSLTYIESKTDTDKNIHREKEVVKQDTIEIKGTIVDERTKEPIPFVVIISEKYSIKTTTDFDGKFKILVPHLTDSKEFELQIKQIGYKDKIVTYSIDKIFDKDLYETLNASINLKNIHVSTYTMGIFVEPPKKWYQFWKKY